MVSRRFIITLLVLVWLALPNLIGCQFWQINTPNNPPTASPDSTGINLARATPLLQSVKSESLATPTGEAQETATVTPTETSTTSPTQIATPIAVIAATTSDQVSITSGVETTTLITGQIAFYSNRDGNDEIYLMDENGSQQIRLTTDPASDLFPHLSPDGRQVVFNSNRDGNWEIYVMNIDGSQQTRLTNHPAEDRLPAWSPDGHWLAFSSDRDGTANIYIMKTDGHNLLQLTFGPDRKGHPTWSTDGQWLAFNAGPTETEWEIYRVPVEGGPVHRLTTNNVTDWAPNWSPSGNNLLFLSKRPDNADIYRVTIDDSAEQEIFSGPGYEWGAVWSPDGQAIAFTSDQTGRDEIYTMRVDGSGLHRVTDLGGAYPSWSTKPPVGQPITLAQPIPTTPPVTADLPTVLPSTPLPPVACHKPVEDYSQVTVNGETINRRTELMLETAIILYGGPADLKRIAQGSYTNDLEASFGTHAGGGVVDISIRNPANPTERLFGETEAMVHALRLAGFAAWYREADLLFPGMAPHIHAVAIGDQELSSAAQEQLIGLNGYFRGYDGLPTDSPNPDPHGGPIICDWMLELGYADLR